MSSSPVRLDRDGAVAIAVLDNAAGLNALTLPMQTALRALLAEVRADRSVRALLLVAEGRAFCVGADLSSLGAPEPNDERTLGERTAQWMRGLTNPLVQELHEMPVPVVAAVNGPCAGGGVGLALAADIVIAARSAYFYLPFIAKLGIVPDVGSSWFVQRLAGRGRALGLALTGERLHAEQAVAWGLAWAVVDDGALRERALELAQRLTLLPAHGALEARRAVDAAARHTLAEQLEYEAQRQSELLNRPSFLEGVQAFFAKRAPRFPGR